MFYNNVFRVMLLLEINFILSYLTFSNLCVDLKLTNTHNYVATRISSVIHQLRRVGLC